MHKINDGGPAFPFGVRQERVDTYGGGEPYVEEMNEPGMTLLDWFAGQALAGIMANPERWRDIARRYDEGKMSYDDASLSNATKAYSLGRAMLAVRAAGEKETGK